MIIVLTKYFYIIPYITFFNLFIFISLYSPSFCVVIVWYYVFAITWHVINVNHYIYLEHLISVLYFLLVSYELLVTKQAKTSSGIFEWALLVILISNYINWLQASRLLWCHSCMTFILLFTLNSSTFSFFSIWSTGDLTV